MNAGCWRIGANGWLGKWDGIGEERRDRRRDDQVEL